MGGMDQAPFWFGDPGVEQLYFLVSSGALLAHDLTEMPAECVTGESKYVQRAPSFLWALEKPGRPAKPSCAQDKAAEGLRWAGVDQAL